MKQILIIVLLVICLTSIALDKNLCAEINEGLIAYYTFNKSAVDESGNNNDGIAYEVTYSESNNGALATFDSYKKSYIKVPNSDSLNSSIFSVSCSFFISSDKNQVIIDKKNSHLKRNFMISILDKKINGHIGDGENNYGVSDSSSLTLNTICHIVLTYDQEYLKLYINGTEQDKTLQNTSSNIGTGDIFIGCHGDSVNYFHGSIMNLRVYNRAVTNNEISKLYNIDTSVSTNVTDTDEDGVIDKWDNCPGTPVDSCIDNRGCICANNGLYTQDEVDLMVNKLLEWDANNDGKLDLTEAIHSLQISAGLPKRTK